MMDGAVEATFEAMGARERSGGGGRWGSTGQFEGYGDRGGLKLWGALFNVALHETKQKEGGETYQKSKTSPHQADPGDLHIPNKSSGQVARKLLDRKVGTPFNGG